MRKLILTASRVRPTFCQLRVLDSLARKSRVDLSFHEITGNVASPHDNKHDGMMVCMGPGEQEDRLCG